MNTILNLMVCFLLVAQLISSSYLLIHSNYKLSDSPYSINRMEIYQMKYENIADRIRRLAAAPKDNSGGNGRDSGSNRTVGLRQVELSRNQNAANGPEGRPRYQQALKYTKFTMETDNSVDQQPDASTLRTLLKEKISPNHKDKRACIDLSTNCRPTLPKEKDGRVFVRREEAEEPIQEDTRGLGKVKSQSTLKMQQIIHSFNNYKLNKEKFITSISKSHSRTETEPTRRYTPENAKPEQGMAPQDTRRLLSEIDNIWNEEPKEEEKASQFQRSRRMKCGLDDLADILNETIQLQENSTENKPKELSKGKIFLKGNVKADQTTITAKPQMHTILSPRGVRAPGKICKNNTRQPTTLELGV